MDFDVCVQDGHHVRSSSPPPRSPGVSKASLLIVPHSFNKDTWVLLLKRLHVNVQVPLQVLWIGKKKWVYFHWRGEQAWQFFTRLSTNSDKPVIPVSMTCSQTDGFQYSEKHYFLRFLKNFSFCCNHVCFQAIVSDNELFALYWMPFLYIIHPVCKFGWTNDKHHLLLLQFSATPPQFTALELLGQCITLTVQEFMCFKRNSSTFWEIRLLSCWELYDEVNTTLILTLGKKVHGYNLFLLCLMLAFAVFYG